MKSYHLGCSILFWLVKGSHKLFLSQAMCNNCLMGVQNACRIQTTWVALKKPHRSVLKFTHMSRDDNHQWQKLPVLGKIIQKVPS